MESLITLYDRIFFNESRLSELIDDYTETSEEKRDALGMLINCYIVCRGRNIPDTSPMSMLVVMPQEFDPHLLECILNDLAGGKCPASIQSCKGKSYISLY